MVIYTNTTRVARKEYTSLKKNIKKKPTAADPSSAYYALLGSAAVLSTGYYALLRVVPQRKAGPSARPNNNVVIFRFVLNFQIQNIPPAVVRQVQPAVALVSY